MRCRSRPRWRFTGRGLAFWLAVGGFDRAQAENASWADLARRCGDPGEEAAALSALGFASLWAHDFDRAVMESRAAIAIARPAADGRAVTRAHLTLGAVNEVTGRLPEGKAELERVIALAPSVGDHFGETMALLLASLPKNWEGDFGAAIQLQSEGIRRAREHGFVVPLLQGLWMHGMSLVGKGAYDDAASVLAEGLALSEKVGEEVNLHRMLNTLGWLWAEVGDVRRAILFNQRGAERARKVGFPETIANSELNLGELALAEGDLAAATERLDGVLRLVRDPSVSAWMKWRYSTRLFASLGELALARGETAKAREWTDQCLEIATRTNARKNLLKGWRLRGQIGTARRQWEEAEAAFTTALTIARTIGNPTQLWKTYVAIGRFHRERRATDPARLAYEAARDVVEGIKSGLRSQELRAGFESSPLIRRVYELSRPA